MLYPLKKKKKGNLNKEEIIELKKDLEESGCKIKLLNNE